LLWICKDSKHAGIAINAGSDMDMESYVDHLGGIGKRKVKESFINDAARRMSEI
jgi:hypothetical protein